MSFGLVARVGLLYGASYVNQPEDDDTKAYDGYVDLTACLFFTYVCAAVSSGAKAIPEFFAHKRLFERERAFQEQRLEEERS